MLTGDADGKWMEGLPFYSEFALFGADLHSEEEKALDEMPLPSLTAFATHYDSDDEWVHPNLLEIEHASIWDIKSDEGYYGKMVENYGGYVKNGRGEEERGLLLTADNWTDHVVSNDEHPQDVLKAAFNSDTYFQSSNIAVFMQPKSQTWEGCINFSTTLMDIILKR